MALSADGYKLLVGSAGTVWRFSLSDGGVWQEVERGISASTLYGWSVALSYDGFVGLMSSPDENQTGAVLAFIGLGQDIIDTTRLMPPDPTVRNFGVSVALSAAGDVALVGASGVGNQEGSAWVFTCTDAPDGSGKVWSSGVKLPERSDRGNNNGFGCSVALSADGAWR